MANFSHFSSRLTSLTRKNATWKGGILPPGAADAFQHLKRALCCAPTLGNPLPDRRFYLHAVASKGTAQVSGMLGWAVTQKDEKWRHLPLSFGSRVLQGHEENLSVNFLERLAIIEGFQDNYIWLHGRPLTILSYNKPAIAKAKSQEKGILGQLQYLLSTSGARLECNKGTNQVIPDFMSRFKAPRVERGNVCSVDQMPYLEKIEEKQNEDAGTRQTIQNLVEGNPEYKDFGKQLFVSQGTLFRRFEGSEKVVIPSSYAEEFITETHLDPIIKHMGAQKIIGRIQDYVYIKFLSKLAHKVVKSCGSCIQNRTLPTSEQHAPLQDPDYPKCIASQSKEAIPFLDHRHNSDYINHCCRNRNGGLLVPKEELDILHH